MFGISWPEMGVIAVVALIVIGPKDLPRVLRSVGQWMGKAQRMASDFRRALDQAAREAGVDEVKKAVETASSLTPAGQVKKALTSTIAKAAEPAKAAAPAAVAEPEAPVINPTTGDPVAPPAPPSATPTAKTNGHADPAQAASAPAPAEQSPPPKSAAGGTA